MTVQLVSCQLLATDRRLTENIIFVKQKIFPEREDDAWIIKMLPGVALLLVVAGVVQYLKAAQKKGRGAGHRFESLKALMSPGELKFFRALEEAEKVSKRCQSYEMMF